MDTLSLPTYAHTCAGEQAEELLRRHGYAERETFAAPDGTPVRSLWRSAPFHGGNDRWRSRRAARRERDGHAAGWAAR
ncbi:hypothetical protein V2I01_36430 [Micromonospora sp. BRA006-A]|nr:hypothetical protein [Micromonospora sp. BRA006-A]